MKKFVVIIMLGIFFQGVNLHSEEKRYSGTKEDLYGRWVSKSIDGDALFFIVSELEGRMFKDGRFQGIIHFTDFQTASRIGTFDVDKGYVYFHVKHQEKPYKLKFWFNDKDRKVITVKDEKFGVTLTLKKSDKKLQDDSTGILSDF